jgi:hypothetical protein
MLTHFEVAQLHDLSCFVDEDVVGRNLESRGKTEHVIIFRVKK